MICFVSGRHYCYIRLLYSRGSTDCSRGDKYRQSQFQNIWKLHASSRGFLHIWPCLACVHSQHWSVHWDKLVAVLLVTTRGRGKYSYLIWYNKRVMLVITFYWLQQVGEGGIVMILYLRGDYLFSIGYSKGVSIYIQGADE